MDEPKLVKVFVELRTVGLGYGECSAIALASARGCKLAIDDRKARREAAKRFPNLTLIKTQELVVQMIKRGLLTVEQADVMKHEWEIHHRFRLKIRSFADLL